MTPAAPPAVPTARKTYLVVVAHPDDENMMGDALAKFARQGHVVHVVIATDGKGGTRVTKIPAGDELGRIRRRESQCACERLGVPPPVFLGIERLDTAIGTRAYLDARKQLLASLERQIESLAPDAVLTFGPDGEYGHSEHIVAGAAVTELVLRNGWVEKHPVYYFAWRKEQTGGDSTLAWLDPRYLDVKVAYSDSDERRTLEAARCYATQFTPREIEDLVRDKTADPLNEVYFRRLRVRGAAEGRALEEW